MACKCSSANVRCLQEILEDVLQRKLNQPGRNGGLRDDAEAGSAEVGAGVGELRMIQRVVELGAKRELRVFAEAADGGGFADGNIRVELIRSSDDAHPCIAVACGAVGADGGNRADS